MIIGLYVGKRLLQDVKVPHDTNVTLCLLHPFFLFHLDECLVFLINVILYVFVPIKHLVLLYEFVMIALYVLFELDQGVVIPAEWSFGRCIHINIHFI